MTTPGRERILDGGSGGGTHVSGSTEALADGVGRARARGSAAALANGVGGTHGRFRRQISGGGGGACARTPVADLRWR
uniref:DUF834 domain-containing protein n=1 Tax=Oryza rufipogon TaxID=4529 RepID=A0A0E0NH40_ORYRU